MIVEQLDLFCRRRVWFKIYWKIIMLLYKFNLIISLTKIDIIFRNFTSNKIVFRNFIFNKVVFWNYKIVRFSWNSNDPRAVVSNNSNDWFLFMMIVGVHWCYWTKRRSNGRGSTSFIRPGIVWESLWRNQILTRWRMSSINIAPLGSSSIYSQAVALNLSFGISEGQRTALTPTVD